MRSAPPLVGTVAFTEAPNESLGTAGPVTAVAGMFAGFTDFITPSCSSVVYWRRPSIHWSVVIPCGWFTQAFAHSSMTCSASGAGLAEVGVCGGLVIRVPSVVDDGPETCPPACPAPPDAPAWPWGLPGR